MKKTGEASYRQVWTAVFLAALAPAATLPSVVAPFGPWGWLGVVLLLPLAALYPWLVKGLGRSGLGAALRTRWGRLGRWVLAVYYLWAAALAALTAGGCVDRLGRTDYGEVPGWLAAVLLAAVAAYLIYRGRAAFLRAVQVFFLALMVVLGLFFLLGVANLQGENLRPDGWRDVWRGAGGLWPALATVSVGAVGSFLPHAPRQEGESPGWKWLAGWCAAAAGLCILVLGALGAELTAKAPLPFFLALQGIGFPGGFQRLEALATAAWVLSDLTLLGMAALVGWEIAGGSRWGTLLPLAGAVIGGCLLPNAVVREAAPVLMGVNLALGAALPVGVSLLPARQKEGQG